MFTGMKVFSHSCRAFYRVLALVLAFHFLNCSIDGRDKNPDFVEEDLRYNDIETFAEFFAEIVLNCHDAFQEHDEKDDESRRSFDFYQYYFSNPALVVNKAIMSAISVEYNNSKTEFVLYVSLDVVAPPPKV